MVNLMFGVMILSIQDLYLQWRFVILSIQDLEFTCFQKTLMVQGLKWRFGDPLDTRSRFHVVRCDLLVHGQPYVWSDDPLNTKSISPMKIRDPLDTRSRTHLFSEDPLGTRSQVKIRWLLFSRVIQILEIFSFFFKSDEISVSVFT